MKEIESKEELKGLVEDTTSGNKVLVVLFTASWCNPCRIFQPVFEKITAEYSNRPNVLFVQVNTNKLTDVAKEKGIRYIPTLLIYRNGEQSSQEVGALGEGQLRRFLNNNL